MKTEDLICPFCREADFDLIGLKFHLGSCDEFDAVQAISNPMIESRASTSPVTADQVKAAAESIAKRYAVGKGSTAVIAAIITRHLAGTPSPTSETPVGAQKRNEDGELTSTCKHCGQPISQTVSTGSWYHDSGWSRMCTRLNAAPVHAAGDDEGDARVVVQQWAETLSRGVMSVMLNSYLMDLERRVAAYGNGRAAAVLRSGEGEGK